MLCHVISGPFHAIFCTLVEWRSVYLLQARIYSGYDFHCIWRLFYGRGQTPIIWTVWLSLEIQLNISLFSPKAAAPKQWKAYDGKVTEMDTPYTIRAQELRDIYSTLSMKYLTQDERLDVLLTLKHTVKEHDCKLTQEIIELIDREADLLMRGVKESNLEGIERAEGGII